MNEGHTRDRWERARVQAAVTIQPHIRKKITPRQLIPLPWDYEKAEPQTPAPTLTAEQRLERFQTLAANV